MKHVLMRVMVASLVMGLLGCSKPAETRDNVDSTDDTETIVQPMSDYEDKAVEVVTPENAEAQLERITNEIEGDK